jgi:putative copper export protein
MPILFLFSIGPLVAVFFLTKQSARQWAIILIGILIAGLFYNIYSRFTALSPLALHKPEMIWEIIYEASFGAMLVLEVIGFWLTMKVLQEIHKQINSSSEKQIR